MTFTWKRLFVLCILGVGKSMYTRDVLGDFQTLTLKSGEYTVWGRVAAIPKPFPPIVLEEMVVQWHIERDRYQV